MKRNLNIEQYNLRKNRCIAIYINVDFRIICMNRINFQNYQKHAWRFEPERPLQKRVHSGRNEMRESKNYRNFLLLCAHAKSHHSTASWNLKIARPSSYSLLLDDNQQPLIPRSSPT